MKILHDLFFDYTLRTVATGAAILGVVSGALGSYAVLRKQSLIGDAVSHATLPGICLAFLITSRKTPFVMMVGAALIGWLAILLVSTIVRQTRIKEDAALGIILAVFFGIGIFMLTLIQKLPNSSQSGLDKFLFGQAAALLERDIHIMAIVGSLTIGVMLLFWKEFKLLSFDPTFAQSLGLPIKILDILLMTLIVLAIVIGLQAVGVVLMSAMIVAPAVAARQWTNKLSVMIGLAAFFGAVAGTAGAIISSMSAKTPTGPMIVISISLIVIFSLVFAPERGVIWQVLKRSYKFPHRLTDLD